MKNLLALAATLAVPVMLGCAVDAVIHSTTHGGAAVGAAIGVYACWQVLGIARKAHDAARG